MKGLAGKKKALWRMYASHNKGRRILAIVTSFFLIGGMLNAPRKAQAQNTSADEYQLVTEFYYDSTNPTAKTMQVDPMKALSVEASKRSGSKVVLPSSDTLVQDIEIQKAFSNAQIQSVEFDGDSTPQDIFPDFSEPVFEAAQGKYINYERVGNNWQFAATDQVTSTQTLATRVPFKSAYFKCTYITGATQYARVNLSKFYDISYSITLDNAQNIDKTNIETALGSGEINTEFKVAKTICNCSLKAYAGYSISSNAAPDLNFSSEQIGTEGNLTLSITVKPSKILAKKTVTITFTPQSPNNASFDINVTFSKTSPATIKLLSELELPYREHADQNNALKDRKYWRLSNNEEIDPAYLIDGKNLPLKDVDIDYKGNYDGSSDLTTTATLTKDREAGSEFWETFSFKPDAETYTPSVTVKKIEEKNVTKPEDVPADVFWLTKADQSEKTDLAKNPADVDWVNWDAPLEFMYEDHQLSSKTDAGFSFADLYQVNDTQGINKVEAVYAKDNESKIIEKITNITYKYDITPPKPTNYTVSDPGYKGFDFWLFDKSAQMTVDVTDKNTQDPSIDVAGLKPEGGPEGNSLSYYDKHGERTMDGGLCTLSADGVSGEFNFNIDGDQQTDIKGSTQVHLVDNAGNVYDGGLEGTTNIPENVRDLVIQSGNPSLRLNWIEGGEAHHGSYYNQNRRAVFTITMPAFEYLKEADPDQVIITITTGDKNSGYAGGNTVYVTAKQFAKLSNQYVQDGKDEFSYVAYFDRETDYKINTQITSLLPQYAASLPEETFTIDKTAPVLNVSFDNNNVRNGKYYNASRTATVTIAEHNFDPSLIKLQVTSTDTNGAPAGSFAVSGWSNSGDIHTATVNFPQDGTYQIQEISGTDLADNTMATYGDSSFVIDTQKPTIALSVNGETDAASHAYKDGAPLSISLDDTNIDPSSTIEVVPVGLNSKANPYASAPTAAATHVEYAAASPAVTAENDNLYRATIHAVDLAGNEDTKTCEWSVNRFGSVYTVNQETKDMLDKQYIKGSDATDATIIEINPSGIDQSSAKVNISNGANNTDLQNGSGFQLNAANWDNLPAYNYVIPKANFANDGTYQITVQSHDLAGNASSNTMDNRNLDRTNTQSVIFAIDNTAPVVSFSGFNEYEVPEPTHDVTIKVEDNIALDKAVLKMSDGTETTLSADEFDPTSHNATITLHETGAPQQVEVRAYDKAGNMNPEYSPSIVVSTNPFVLWANNPIIVAITLVALLCIIAAAVYHIRRKKLSEAE